MSDKQKEATSLIVEQLVQSGIKLVASLPDDWIVPLIHAIDKDDDGGSEGQILDYAIRPAKIGVQNNGVLIICFSGSV